MLRNTRLIIGHKRLAIFYTVLSTWWAINIFRDYFYSKYKQDKTFKSRPYYLGPFIKYPLESVAKIIYSMIVFPLVWIFAVQENKTHEPETFVHAAMSLTIFLNGLCDVLKFHKFPLPDGCEVASGMMTIFAHGYLMYAHSRQRIVVDSQFHLLISCVAFAAMLVVFLETTRLHLVMLSLARCGLVHLYGTWQFQAGYLYHGPFIKYFQDHPQDSYAIASVLFYGHCLMNMLYIFVVGCFVYLWLKYTNRLNDYQQLKDSCMHA